MPLGTIFLDLIIIGVLLLLVSFIPMHATIKQIIYIVAILAVILWLARALFGIGPGVQLR